MARALVAAIAVLAFVCALGAFMLETDRLAQGLVLFGLPALSVVALITFAETPAPPA